MDKNKILIVVAVLAIIVTGALIYAKSNGGFSLPSLFGASDKDIAEKAVKYINDNGLAGTTASLVSFSEAEGLVKIKIKIGTTEYDSYATKNGKLFFPQGYELTPKAGTNTGNNAAAATGQTAEEILAAMKKADKPVIEAFVVSSCPYGLQMQRMIADAVKNIPSLASNITIKYIGSVSNGQITSMHDAAANGGEAQENLRQICIREEQPAKFYNYLSCYMKKASGALPNGMPLGDSKGCLASTGVDTSSLSLCMSSPSRGLAYAQKDFDAATKYGVGGSPTVVVNGATVEEFTADNQPVFGSGRSSDEIKEIICAASNTKPSFCSQKLNTAQAATSFSATYEGVSTGATGAAGCAPAQ
ncbi:MAG: hypothetical protein NT026_00485 [Candidatus Staskawiczbacteria bacterium]|nr:hypothetical protein [Candidatus Staskawiczbacteria bacterium]